MVKWQANRSKETFLALIPHLNLIFKGQLTIHIKHCFLHYGNSDISHNFLLQVAALKHFQYFYEDNLKQKVCGMK